MKTKQKYNVGVIVGRFQVPRLHEEHHKLINLVKNKHEKYIIFLGSTPLKTTKNNPLDYEAREQMIRQSYPDAIILPILDTKEDDVWSRNLDAAIAHVIGPGQKPLLYGGRDSFIKCYKGKYATEELLPTVYLSGSEIRSGVGNKVINSEDFRAGVVWASQNQYPKTFACVDIAIFNEEGTKMLLARKPNESKYRFVGGFSDPSSENFGEDAVRELYEETGIATYVEFVWSTKIDDWRYRGEVDKIITMVFRTNVPESVNAKAQDDICELKWFDIKDVQKNIVDSHIPILKVLKLYENN